MRLMVACTLLGVAMSARAQSLTAFTYQGELKSDGVNYNGAADLRFRLFDAAAGGQQVGPLVTMTAVPVSAGRFTTMLDFGPVFQSGAAGYIEMDVRTPAGVGSYTTLGGRQAVGVTPLAQGLAGVMITPSQASAVDQSQWDPGFGYFNIQNSGPVWQSFTAGKTGRLDKVVVGTDCCPGSKLTVNVRTGLGIAGQIIATTTATLPNGRGLEIPLPGPLVISGSVYTLEFTSDDIATLLVSDSNIPGASGGTNGGSMNWCFQTYVSQQATIGMTASVANQAPWSGVSGVPAAVASPPLYFSKSQRSQASLIVAAPNLTPISNSSLAATLQGGIAIVNWSLTCYTNVANTGIEVQVRATKGVTTTLSTPVRYFFNTPSVHQTVSGSSVINVEDGSQVVDLVVTRYTGTGGFYVDSNDSLTYTIINAKQ